VLVVKDPLPETKPQMPYHVVLFPKKDIKSLDDAGAGEQKDLLRCFRSPPSSSGRKASSATASGPTAPAISWSATCTSIWPAVVKRRRGSRV